MNLAYNILIDVYSIGILITIYIFSTRQNADGSLQNKLYKQILQLTILMLFVDILSRFDGRPGTIYPVLNHIGNFIIFLLNPVISSLWLLYVHDQVFHKIEKTRQLSYCLIIVNLFNVVILIMTQFFGWYYYIDIDNIYHRGPLFWLSVSLTVIYVVLAFVLTILYRKRINQKHYFSLLFFAVPPFIGIIVHTIFYGFSIVLNGTVLSILIVSLNIQNNSIYTDYLTGVNNRKKLELYLKQKINTSSKEKTFSAIMLDLNNFKTINDNYGHDLGDNALQISAKLLGSCLHANDFLARFGGDEFFVVLDISDKEKLTEVVNSIERCLIKYNNTSKQPYQLSFSMGYAVYDYSLNMNMEDFQKQIDILMYENKQYYKESQKIIENAELSP